MTDEWQRLDPRTLATQPVATAAKALIPALAWLVGAGSAVGFNIVLPITIAGVLLVGALPWLTTSFRITALVSGDSGRSIITCMRQPMA